MAHTEAQWETGREAAQALLDAIGEDEAVREVRLEESAFLPPINIVIEVEDGSAVSAQTWEEIGRITANTDDEVYEIQINDCSTRWSGAYSEIPWRQQGGTDEGHAEEEGPRPQRVPRDPEDEHVGRTRRFAREVGAPVPATGEPSGSEPNPKLQRISEQARGAERLVRVVRPIFRRKPVPPPAPKPPPKEQDSGVGPALVIAAFLGGLALLAAL